MKRLVVYYSLTGNTEEAAEKIAKALNADLLKLETVKDMPKSFAARMLVGGGQVAFNRIPELKPFAEQIAANGGRAYIDKPVFGAEELGLFVRENGYDDVTLIGVCTGICVISNAVIIRAFNPETDVNVVADLCACLTPETHQTALDAMKTFQVNII